MRVIIPNYMCLPAKFKEKMRYLTHFHMDIGWKQQYVGVMYLEYEGFRYTLLTMSIISMVSIFTVTI